MLRKNTKNLRAGVLYTCQVDVDNDVNKTVVSLWLGLKQTEQFARTRVARYHQHD